MTQFAGRNDPCPCGSGKKYKKCCLGRNYDEFDDHNIREMMQAINKELHGRNFGSLEEVRAAAGEVVKRKNLTGIPEFAGLSPEQMHRIMYFPFESPNLVSFAEDFPAPMKSPVIVLFNMLAELIGQEGVRATAKGNLPRIFCQESYTKFIAAGLGDRFSAYHKVNKEEDFSELHNVRLVAAMAGLIKKRKGKFHLTARGRKAIKDSTRRQAYFELFRASAQKLNWAYFDYYPNLYIVQTAFMYTLYLLHLNGDEFRPSEFYGDLFLKAFPATIKEVPPTSYSTPCEQVTRCHNLRTLERFALFFGIAEKRDLNKGELIHEYEVKKSPVLDLFINFSP